MNRLFNSILFLSAICFGQSRTSVTALLGPGDSTAGTILIFVSVKPPFARETLTSAADSPITLTPGLAGTTTRKANITTRDVLPASVGAFNGSNICIVDGITLITLSDCLKSLPARGGRVFFDPATSQIAITHTNPFYGVTAATSRINLGAGIFPTSTSWVMNANSNNGNIIQGLGRGGGKNFNTTIQASGTFASAPVIELSSTTLSFGNRLEDLAVDCNNTRFCTGIRNDNGQEQTQIRNILIQGFNNIGLDLESEGGGQHQNSGPYENLEVIPGSSAGADTVGIKAGTSGNASTIREMANITVNSTGAGTIPNSPMVIYDPGVYRNMHFDGCAVSCITINTGGVTIINADCITAVTTCITIGPGLENINLLNIRVAPTVTNILVDKTNSNICTVAAEGQSLGIYSLGAGVIPVPLVTSAFSCAKARLNGVPQIIAKGTAAMTTSLIAAATCGTTVTVAASGAGGNDVIQWNFQGPPPATAGVLIVNAWNSSNSVSFRYCNPTAKSITPGAATLSWMLLR